MNNRASVATGKVEAEFALNPPINLETGLRRLSNTCREMLHQLKEAITTELAARFSGTLRPEIVRQVVNEADALAAATGFRALFLPTLAEEKAIVASRWQVNQRRIQERAWVRTE